MKWIVAAQLLCLCVCSGKFVEIEMPAAKVEQRRLVVVGETDRRLWMPVSTVRQMQLNHEPFMDITEYQWIDAKTTAKARSALPVDLKGTAKSKFGEISMETVEKNLKVFTSFKNRYYRAKNGRESADWLKQRLEALVEEYKAQNVQVSKFPHSWNQPSIIARFEPSARGQRAEDGDVVIISAHQDSTSGLFMPSKNRAPGADDNGSGSMTILEAFRVLLATDFSPEKPVEFHWYSAEEAGLLGSQDVAAFYHENRIPVVGVYHVDMDGYVKRGTEKVIGVATDYTNADLTEFLGKLIEEYCEIPAMQTKCGYACSDHASWTRTGYPSSFTMEGKYEDSNPYIHTNQDTIEKLDFEHMKEYVKLALSFAVELAE